MNASVSARLCAVVSTYPSGEFLSMQTCARQRGWAACGGNRSAWLEGRPSRGADTLPTERRIAATALRESKATARIARSIDLADERSLARLLRQVDQKLRGLEPDGAEVQRRGGAARQRPPNDTRVHLARGVEIAQPHLRRERVGAEPFHQGLVGGGAGVAVLRRMDVACAARQRREKVCVACVIAACSTTPATGSLGSPRPAGCALRPCRARHGALEVAERG